LLLDLDREASGFDLDLGHNGLLVGYWELQKLTLYALAMRLIPTLSN
jgi:hypothetical protein